jgi:hypothetical protein
MIVEVNSRGNGACPLCSNFESCHVQEKILDALSDFSSEDYSMELVIYSCPYFDEK